MERFDSVSTTMTLMPGVYDLRFRTAEWHHPRERPEVATEGEVSEVKPQ